MTHTWFAAAVVAFGLAGQLAPRPPADWMQRMERPERIAGLKIEYIIAKLGLKPGQVIADIGAGPGVLSVPIAKAVSPGGKVYAVDLDRAFLDHIEMRARERNVTNITAVLGKPGDPGLPAQDVDVALFHDVLHHIADRAGYLNAMARYVKPGGRFAIVEPGPEATHKGEPELILTRDQVAGWMAAAGFKPVQDIEGLNEGKWFVVYSRR
ncbi:MAG TPA: class I SAM-dependent methyltransferase [Vicinamibacterales bacterium]|nr:class I SAM-dependent methyltransferase [Vicinamibacterales bacterium]